MTLKAAKPQSTVLLWLFVAVCLFVYLCHIAAGIMIPFVVAVFIWYLINAVARFLGNFRYSKAIPRLWRFVLAILFLLSIVVTIFELVHQNIDDVTRSAPQFQQSFTKIAGQAAAALHLDHTPTMQEIWGDLTSRYLNIGVVMREFAALLTAMAGKTLIVLIFVGFLLYEQRYFARKLKWMIRDPETEERVHEILLTIDVKIQKYIGVKSFVSLLDSILTYAILSFFGVEFAEFWGVMAFFLHFIPYAGSFFAISLPGLITLIQFGDIGTVAAVVATLCVSHAFLGHILDPYMMGNNLNLSPIFIISNLGMWGLVWGVPGMFLAIPILAITALALEQFPATRPVATLLSKTGVLSTLPKSPLSKILQRRK